VNLRRPFALARVPSPLHHRAHGGHQSGLWFPMKLRKLLQKTMNAPQNVRFAELCRLAVAFGYTLDRVNGSHHIFVHPKATRPLNLQDVGGKAKPYQVKQFLRDIEEFQLTLRE
jgi:predicted RNA binding protein YcfA (HicA-like mRNA interferase family)